MGILDLDLASQRGIFARIGKSTGDLGSCLIMVQTSTATIATISDWDKESESKGLEPSWDYAFYTRAAFQVLRVFTEMRRSEVMLLVCLKSILVCQDGNFVSTVRLFKGMSGNRRRWPTYLGCLAGLIRGGYCKSYEYTPKKGSIVIGITDKGQRVLDIFSRSIIKAKGSIQRTGKKPREHFYKEIDIYY